MKGITVTAETYGAHDDGPDVIVVRVDGREVGAYCIADDAEAERVSMERMARAIYRAGMREGAERMRERAARDCEAMARASDWGVWTAAERCAAIGALHCAAIDIRALPLDDASESEEADRG